MRVLVVDDDPDVLFLCRMLLEAAGHQILEAIDGHGAEEVASLEHPDLIVLDIMLPDVDGLSVLLELSRRPETKNLPVVLLSAKARQQDQIRGFMAGAREYVTKPFVPAALVGTIQRVWEMNPEGRARHRVRRVSELSEAIVSGRSSTGPNDPHVPPPMTNAYI